MTDIDHNQPMAKLPASPSLTAAEAASRLGISRWMVGHLCREGVFPGAVKLPAPGPWLIPVRELPRYEAWCAKRPGATGKRGRPPWHTPKRARG